MIVLDYQDRRPLYEQVEEKFRNLILKGVLEPGSRMPSVRQLAMELSINPNTIQRKAMIQKGKAMGMNEEELIYIIGECYKEEKP